ncbi:MAG: glycosyltransferase [Blastocatellia bacterium]
MITPRNAAYYVDASLEDGTDRGIEVVRTKAFELSSFLKRFVPGRTRNGTNASGSITRPLDGNRLVNAVRRTVRTWVYIPDGQIGWYPYALSASQKVDKMRGVDAIFSTAFPITSHLVAYKLKCATNKPWIADFRDLWTENHCGIYTSRLRKRLDQVIEGELLDKADALITVSDRLAETLRDLTGGRKRVEVIRNGFDEADFDGIERRPLSKWTITIMGTFYSFVYDPSPCLRALRRLMKSGKIDRSDVQFKIIGDVNPFVTKLVESFGLEDVSSFTGFLQQREVLRHEVNSSLLLFLVYGEKANPGVLTGKLFEYLGSRTPMLAIVPFDFEAAQIIRDTGAGTVVEPEDDAGIERCLLDSYSQFKSGVRGAAMNSADLSQYERKQSGQQLAALLSELAG